MSIISIFFHTMVREAGDTLGDHEMRTEIVEWLKGDPISQEQVQVLSDLLAGRLTEDALEGFLIVSSRFVDEFGGHRTSELATMFKTESDVGKEVLRVSLEHVCRWVKGLKGYTTRYPVTIIPPRPAFPLFKIIGIHKLADRIYRVLDSRATIYKTNISVKDHIIRTGRLPAVPRQKHPVRRSKPRFHWCSYESWADPEATVKALQILPEWSNAKLRAVLPTRSLKNSAYIAFSLEEKVQYDSQNNKLYFNQYFYELLTHDHPSLPGGGPQIGVEGSPLVNVLEEWSDSAQKWEQVWKR